MRRILMEEEEGNVALTIIKMVCYILVIISVIVLVIMVSGMAPDKWEQIRQLVFIAFGAKNL
ncbi:MAG: hypothetical protein ACFFCM_20360 [Promethearchaeota archaeon]